MKVTAQINNGDPCPKRENRAWDWASAEFSTLSECIAFLIDKGACGFQIFNDEGNIIAEDVWTHYSSERFSETVN
jgi:hypothetical protein